MDITTLDHATGRLVVQLRLEEIMEALEHSNLDNSTTASYRALRHTLRDQLEMMGEEVCTCFS
jgi:hypothetical protein